MRDAFERSVACTRASGELPQEPRVDGPERDAVAASGRARIHSSFVAEKYGSGVSPVRARIRSAGSSRQRSAVRRSCQTIAGWTRLARPRGPRRSSSRAGSRSRAASTSRIDAPHAASARSRRGFDARPQLARVLLDPAGLRCGDRHRRVAAAEHLELVVDQEARRAGRALVDCEYQSRARLQSFALRIQTAGLRCLARAYFDHSAILTWIFSSVRARAARSRSAIPESVRLRDH